MRQTSDILTDGTQDPAKTCDGISIGVGFETLASLEGKTPVTVTATDPCVAN